MSNDPRKSPTPWSRTPRQSLHIPDTPQLADKASSSGSPADSASSAYKADYFPDEFGVGRNEGNGQLKSKSVNVVQAQELKRTTSGSSGSVVAAMRTRYANAVSYYLDSIYHIYSWLNHRPGRHRQRQKMFPVFLLVSMI
jgi:hypothetical protein